MKRLLTTCLLGAFAFAASAQDAPPAQVDVDAQAETQAQIESDRENADARLDANVEAEVADNDKVDRNCLLYTGTHISARRLDEKGKDCVIANGSVYSREDIRSTGAVDLAEALRRLDPAIY